MDSRTRLVAFSARTVGAGSGLIAGDSGENEDAGHLANGLRDVYRPSSDPDQEVYHRKDLRNLLTALTRPGAVTDPAGGS